MMTPNPEYLKSIFAVNSSLSEWATIAVFIGLLGDILVIFLFSKDKPRSETWLAFLFALIIAVGVYGEYAFGSKAAWAAGELQKISDQKVAESNQKASEADERAKAVEGENTQLNLDLEAEKTRSSTAQRLLAEQLTGALQQAAEANRKADEELKARIKLEQALAWRTVTDAQAKTLRHAMRPEYIGVKVGLSVVSGDAEGTQYAIELRDALIKAGWVVDAPSASMFVGLLPEGVWINAGRSDNPAAGLLQHILGLADIVAKGEIKPSIGSEAIDLLIGVKPHAKPAPSSQ